MTAETNGATIIVSMKGRLAHLKESLPTWLEYTPCEVIVASQCCPDDTSLWVQRFGHPRVTPVDVEPAHRPELFEKPYILNCASLLVESDFVLFFDADTRLRPGLWDWLAPRLDRNALYVVAPTPDARDLTGVLGVWQEDFAAVGGYDEGMLGWGSEDLELRLRLHLALGRRVVELPREYFDPIAHDDSLRTRFYAEKDKARSQQQNLQRLVDRIERLTGRSIFTLLEDPVVHRLFHVPT